LRRLLRENGFGTRCPNVSSSSSRYGVIWVANRMWLDYNVRESRTFGQYSQIVMNNVLISWFGLQEPISLFVSINKMSSGGFPGLVPWLHNVIHDPEACHLFTLPSWACWWHLCSWLRWGHDHIKVTSQKGLRYIVLQLRRLTLEWGVWGSNWGSLLGCIR
jgi:hypothetical protein